LIAAALETASIETGHTVIDEFSARFVFFYTGYVAAPLVFALARNVEAAPSAALAGLSLWALVNGFLVFNGIAGYPLVSLALGLAGAIAVVSVSVLLARGRIFEPLR